MSESEILHDIMTGGPLYYDIPTTNGVTVEVEFWIQDIRSLNIHSGRAEISLYVSEKWHDHHLAFSQLRPCSNNITTTGEIFSKAWSPKMAFTNSIEVKEARSPLKNEFVMIYENGTVWKNVRCRHFALREILSH